MSSLKALKLLDNAFLGDEKSIEYVQLHYDTIITKLINDLEILEILKNNTIIIKDKEEFNKVKNWLEENDLQ